MKPNSSVVGSPSVGMPLVQISVTDTYRPSLLDAAGMVAGLAAYANRIRAERGAVKHFRRITKPSSGHDLTPEASRAGANMPKDPEGTNPQVGDCAGPPIRITFIGPEDL